MSNSLKKLFDLKQVYYFIVTAEELNLHRASKRLFISQPPLSRHIKLLEERLGTTLFTRHTRGLTLTSDGKKALQAFRALLKVHDATCAQLQRQLAKAKKHVSFGLTTAFEQGIFSVIEKSLHKQYGAGLCIVRQTSPQLVKEVLKGKVDLAFVALPLETQGLLCIPFGYTEPYIAVLPASWPQSKKSTLHFEDCTNKPLFWFRREQNPAMYDFTQNIFLHEKYTPPIHEEPAEHDVLLARVAAGEGMGLLPLSFAIVHREGVVYRSLLNAEHLCVSLGIIFRAESEAMAQQVLTTACIERLNFVVS